jgi:hypothetical protein
LSCSRWFDRLTTNGIPNARTAYQMHERHTKCTNGIRNARTSRCCTNGLPNARTDRGCKNGPLLHERIAVASPGGVFRQQVVTARARVLVSYEA